MQQMDVSRLRDMEREASVDLCDGVAKIYRRFLANNAETRL